MKIPYEEGIKDVIITIGLLFVFVAMFARMVLPDPIITPIEPSWLWEVGNILTLATATYPTSIVIWIVTIGWFINVWRTPAVKPETKSETIVRLREVNNNLSKDLSYANARITEKVNKLVYIEALLESKRCPKCMEPLEE